MLLGSWMRMEPSMRGCCGRAPRWAAEWEQSPSVPLPVGGGGHGESPSRQREQWAEGPLLRCRGGLSWERSHCPRKTAPRAVEGLVLSEAPPGVGERGTQFFGLWVRNTPLALSRWDRG